jgi:hypothetical protein
MIKAIHRTICRADTARQPRNHVPRARGAQNLRLHDSGFVGFFPAVPAVDAAEISPRLRNR